MEMPLFRDYQIQFVPPACLQESGRLTQSAFAQKLREEGSCQYVRLQLRSASLPDLSSASEDRPPTVRGAGAGEGEGADRGHVATHDPEINSSGMSNDSKDNFGSSGSEDKVAVSESTTETRGGRGERAQGSKGRRRRRGGRNRRRKSQEEDGKADVTSDPSPSPSQGESDLYLPFTIYKQLVHAEVETLASKLHEYFEMQTSVYEENRMDLLQQLFFWREASQKSDEQLQGALNEIAHLHRLNDEYRAKVMSLTSCRRGHRRGHNGHRHADPKPVAKDPKPVAKRPASAEVSSLQEDGAVPEAAATVTKDAVDGKGDGADDVKEDSDSVAPSTQEPETA